MLRTPEFWRTRGVLSALLLPFSYAYRAGAALRAACVTPVALPVPVICIGNLVAGGAGKTPLALAVAELLAHKRVFFLSRGYGGRARGSLVVDPQVHTAEEVGDEPLLLAAHFPTVMAKDRVAGARLAVEKGAEIIIMDDGFQNPSLAKTLSLLAVDGGYGFGNARMIPSGPLREPVQEGLKRADAVVVIGGGFAVRHENVFHARLVPESAISGAVFGFAGIGRPEKFRAALAEMGAQIVGFQAFPDHHPYSERELQAMAAQSVPLVTTEKDHVRLSPAWRERVGVVKVRLEIKEKEAFKAWLGIL